MIYLFQIFLLFLYGIILKQITMKIDSTEIILDENPRVLNYVGDRDKLCKIPRDEEGNVIGTSWEVIRERMYNNLSKHYDVDLKAL